MTSASPVLAASHHPARDLQPDQDLGAPVGLFHTWWRGEALPGLPPVPDLTIEESRDTDLIARATGLNEEETGRRVAQGHRCWLGRFNDNVVAWGWCAHDELSIGELGIDRALPAGDRYLWDFHTMPRWRGQGIYPRLLQAIVTADETADHFWLGHDMGNLASRRGIAKAGFSEVGVVYCRPNGRFTLIPTGSHDHVLAASALFAIDLATDNSGRLIQAPRTKEPRPTSRPDFSTGDERRTP